MQICPFCGRKITREILEKKMIQSKRKNFTLIVFDFHLFVVQTPKISVTSIPSSASFLNTFLTEPGSEFHSFT